LTKTPRHRSRLQPPRPYARLCKLGTIASSGHCVPTGYVVFRVCKRAREFCKLGFRMLKLDTAARRPIVSPLVSRQSAYHRRRLGGDRNEQRPPMYHSCKLGILGHVSYDEIRVYVKNQVCKTPLFFCKLAFLANSAGHRKVASGSGGSRFPVWSAGRRHGNYAGGGCVRKNANRRCRREQCNPCLACLFADARV